SPLYHYRVYAEAQRAPREQTDRIAGRVKLVRPAAQFLLKPTRLRADFLGTDAIEILVRVAVREPTPNRIARKGPVQARIAHQIVVDVGNADTALRAGRRRRGNVSITELPFFLR